jgi:phosphoglycerate-specific signal transduction histidine kinase
VTKSKSTRLLPTTVEGWREEADRIRADLNEQLSARNKEIRSLTKRAQSAESKLDKIRELAYQLPQVGRNQLSAILDGKAE